MLDDAHARHVNNKAVLDALDGTMLATKDASRDR